MTDTQAIVAQYSVLARCCVGDATAVVRGPPAGVIPMGANDPLGMALVPIEGADLGELNRKVEQQIIGVLDGAGLEQFGATVSRNIVDSALMALARRNVPVEDEANMFGVISRPVRQYLIESTPFPQGDYVNVAGGVRMWRSLGVNWLVSSFPKSGFIWHRHAIGHAADFDRMVVGPNGIRLSAGTMLLQPDGAVAMALPN